MYISLNVYPRLERKGIVFAGGYFSSDPLGGPYYRPYGANKWFLPLRSTKQAKRNQEKL